MNKEDILLRRLEENDTVSNFDCGDEDLNDFIFGDAMLYFSLAHDRISLTPAV